MPDVWARSVAVARSPGLGRVYAYVAADYKGLRVIDVTDPTAPVEVGFYGERTQ